MTDVVVEFRAFLRRGQWPAARVLLGRLAPAPASHRRGSRPPRAARWRTLRVVSRAEHLPIGANPRLPTAASS